MKKKKLKTLLESLEIENETAQDILCAVLPPNHRGNLLSHAEQVVSIVKDLQTQIKKLNEHNDCDFVIDQQHRIIYNLRDLLKKYGIDEFKNV